MMDLFEDQKQATLTYKWRSEKWWPLEEKVLDEKEHRENFGVLETVCILI